MDIRSLDIRSQHIFKLIVDEYVATGEPSGSTTLAGKLVERVSPATIRSVMAKLEKVGLLYSPHTSAGRLPTEQGLKLYTQGLLEVGDLSEADRRELESKLCMKDSTLDRILEEVTSSLSGLSKCAGLVLAPKYDSPLKHIEFVYLSEGQALAIIVSQDGNIENRILDIPLGIGPSQLVEASNYLSAKLIGLTLDQAKEKINSELEQEKHQLQKLTTKVVEKGLAVWGGSNQNPTLIVKGQSHLLSSAKNIEDIQYIQKLFQSLETKEDILEMVDAAKKAEGIKVFMGADSPLFQFSGCSMIIAPYKNSHTDVVGAIGVLGPARLNYNRVIPMVNYTAQLIEKFFKNK